MENSNIKSSMFESVTAVSSTRWHEILSAIWLCVVFVGGVLLNGFAIFAFVKNKRLVTGSNIYIIALLFNNLMLCSLAIGMPLVAEFSGHWLQLMDMKACITEAFIVYLFGLASMFVLVAIAMSRYVAITRLSISTNNENKLRAICTVTVCELLAFCFAAAPLMGWGSYGLEAHGTSCGLDWRDRSESAFSYLITITIACFAIPVAIIVFCYIRIYQTVRNSHRIREAVMTTGQRSRERTDKNLLKLSIAFVVSFLISWIPYTVVSFEVAYGKPTNIDPMLSRSAALIAKSQVLWNPVLYFIIAKSFRREAMKMLPCICKVPTTTTTATLRTITNIESVTRMDQTSVAHKTPVLSQRHNTITSTEVMDNSENSPHTSRLQTVHVETALQLGNKNPAELSERALCLVNIPGKNVKHGKMQTDNELQQDTRNICDEVNKFKVNTSILRQSSEDILDGKNTSSAMEKTVLSTIVE